MGLYRQVAIILSNIFCEMLEDWSFELPNVSFTASSTRPLCNISIQSRLLFSPGFWCCKIPYVARRSNLIVFESASALVFIVRRCKSSDAGGRACWFWFDSGAVSGFESDVMSTVELRSSARFRLVIGRGCARGLPLRIDGQVSTEARVRYRWHNATLNVQSVEVEDIPERSTRISNAPEGKRGMSKFIKSGRSKRLVEVRLMSWMWFSLRIRWKSRGTNEVKQTASHGTPRFHLLLEAMKDNLQGVVSIPFGSRVAPRRGYLCQ